MRVTPVSVSEENNVTKFVKNLRGRHSIDLYENLKWQITIKIGKSVNHEVISVFFLPGFCSCFFVRAAYILCSSGTMISMKIFYARWCEQRSKQNSAKITGKIPNKNELFDTLMQYRSNMWFHALSLTVPGKVSKTLGCALTFQRLSRDPASVHTRKNMFDPSIG